MNKEFSSLNIDGESYKIKDIKARPFKTISELKNNTNLVDGDIVKTIGYHTPNDGGGANYLIRTKIETDVIDDGSKIEYSDTLVAELIVNDSTININQFGGKADDNTFDNSIILSKAIDYINGKHMKLLFESGDYYFLTPITKEKIYECEITSNYNSILHYNGKGYFISAPITNNIKISNIKIEGNETNYGLFFGDESICQTMFDNLRMDYFVRYITIERPAYVYFDKCNFYFRNTCEYVMQIGKENERHGSELVTINDCIFGGSQHLTSTGDMLRIYQIQTLRVNNTDFCNTLGHWIVFDNKSDGNLFDMQFIGCTFTRAKQCFEINLSKNRFINNMVFKDCLLSLAGSWSDGETNLFLVNRTQGGIENSYIENLSITNIANTYNPDYIFKDLTNTTYMYINVTRKPNVANKYLITGNQGLRTKATLTLSDKITRNGLENILYKQRNICSLSGSITATGDIGAYTELFSNLFNPETKTNYAIYGLGRDGKIYPCYIDKGILKCRISIPNGTIVDFGCLYNSNEI